MRFRLRTLMIVLAIGPPVLVGARLGLIEWQEWRIRRIEAETFRVEFKRAGTVWEQIRNIEEARAEAKAREEAEAKRRNRLFPW